MLNEHENLLKFTTMGEVDLLFFDTFAHENSEELNLDLVQFPKPVYVTEVRIIPLGARVQADFPGGVRLGATNPSQFSIEFFVNDLGKPGASTFESLGGFDYNQNGYSDGWIGTLEVYFKDINKILPCRFKSTYLSKIIQPVVSPAINTQHFVYTYGTAEQYPPEYTDYYNEIPKDPRSFHNTPETDWDAKSRGLSIERDNRDHKDIDRYQIGIEIAIVTEINKHSDTHRRQYPREEREDVRKRPRTPPLSSPKRPHTPHGNLTDLSVKEEVADDKVKSEEGMG
ncbi:hypothetical protein FQR65_LT19855 [Abscondita terminalis]|nr:hypothetical protein FQR65_LT19855 [Abscondita terminalis]